MSGIIVSICDLKFLLRDKLFIVPDGVLVDLNNTQSLNMYSCHDNNILKYNNPTNNCPNPKIIQFAGQYQSYYEIQIFITDIQWKE